VFTTLTRLTGIDDELANVRLKVSEKASDFARFSVRTVMAGAFAAAAAVCVLVVYLVALVALYLWAEPIYGRFSSLGGNIV
jgi:hypothetical protein